MEPFLEPGELFYLSILTNKPQLKIKLDNSISNPFKTTQGIMQGDCLSAILFIFYLAKALEKSKIKIEAEQNGTFYIEPKYADDITIASINEKKFIEEAEKEFPTLLKAFNLTTNKTKTEHHTVPQPMPTPKPPDLNRYISSGKTLWSELDWVLPIHEKTPRNASWKNCKLLGSKLDTTQDFRARKGNVLSNMKKLDQYFKSKYLSIKTKMKQFNTYIAPIFLYNSELWTTNETINKQIDSFHRRMLRIAIHKTWPKMIYTNTKLYQVTQVRPWSETIKIRRLNWMGHLLRLDPSTPARKSLNELAKPSQKKRGRPPCNWLNTVYHDIKGAMTDIPRDPVLLIQTLEALAADRKRWKDIVRCSTVRKN